MVNSLFAQYTLNGSATQNNCHCYTLTRDDYGLTGSVWNNNKINLNQSFEFSFDVFLGCADSDGADGIAFVLQPISTSVGTQGNGLGYSGVHPALGITIDTWQNGSPTEQGPDGDPYYDHIAIQLNGDLDHKDSMAPLPVNNIAGPVTALAGSDNIEDCQWHILRVKWDAGTRTISAYMDGNLRVSAIIDLVTNVFGGNSLVFWGFTGSTGGSKNLQQMCTALKPLFRFLPDQKKCIREPVYFFDSTISFAPLQKRYWNFGDGSPVDSVNINPVHAYTAAGNYTVTQTVIGADGCTEINSQQMIIGSKPLADFTFNNACMPDGATKFTNTSSAAFGTINYWFWDLGDGDTALSREPSKTYPAAGLKKVKLFVRSLEGCASDTTEHTVQVYEKPVTDFSFTRDSCTNKTIVFEGISSVGDGVISTWKWNLDSANAKPADVQSPSIKYTLPGQYIVSLVTTSDKGCISNIAVQTLNMLPGPVAYFKNEPVCLAASASFIDSSYIAGANTINNWWWDLGNGANNFSENATTSYNKPGDITVQLAVKSNNGCISDTLKKILSVEDVPFAKFAYTSPLCEGVTVRFSDSSIITSGTISGWQWSFDNGTQVTTQNATAVFTAGNHLVKLVVQNGNGCNSNAATATILINPHPLIDFTVSGACSNTPLAFKAINKSAGNIANWQWSFDDGTISAVADTMHIYPAAGTFPVKLFGISSAGCYSDTLLKNITIYSTHAFAGNDTIAATGQPIQLQASGGDHYEWQPAVGLNNPAISNPVATNYTDRIYAVRAFTDAGCESFDSIRIKIYDGPEIYVPTAFTPNGDGLNDLLKVLPVGVKQFKNFTVYNRLGQVVFITDNYSRGWDGFFKGKAQNPGVYIWTVAAVGYQGNEILKKGTVVLLR